MPIRLHYLNLVLVSGSDKAAPLGKSGGAGLRVCVAVLEMSLRREVVVDGGMD